MAVNRVWFLCVLLVLAASTLKADQPGAGAPDAGGEIGIVWARSYQDGLKAAEVESRPAMLFFTASWCPWCHKMEDQTLSQADMVSKLRRFVCVKIDVEKHRDIALAYAISSLPRIIVINTHDEMVGDWLGYRDGEQFLELIAQIQPYITTAAGVRKIPEIVLTKTTPAPRIQRLSVESEDPNQCVDLMGHKDRAVRQRAIGILAKSGSSCLPAVLAALEHDYLGIRIAAWKIVHGLNVTDLKFDPWAPQIERKEAARKLREQFSSRPKRSD